MSIHKAEAIVLNKFDFRETSIIANFYTREYGKISGILKGIRKEAKKFASTVEPFSHNEIVFYKKRNTNLHLVSQCDLRDNFDGIRTNILKIGTGSMISELINMVCLEDDQNESIFNLAVLSLKELEKNIDSDKIMMIFKIKTLALSGFKPHFDSCVSCGNRLAGESKFSVIMGGLLCPGCYNKDIKARPIFRGTIASILHIERNDFKINLNLGMNPLIKKELGFVLNSFLSFHLGKKLKSETILNNLRGYS